MRDRVIVIASDPNGLLYSVTTKNGTVLDANLSEEQLLAQYPDVYQNLRPAIANTKASKSVIEWAGM
jgi:cell division septal protein FtsQ